MSYLAYCPRCGKEYHINYFPEVEIYLCTCGEELTFRCKKTELSEINEVFDEYLPI
jgi:hypothetical protein